MFWLELNMKPKNYRNVNELISDIITLIKKGGTPVYVFTTYNSVQKFAINPMMCKSFNFDYTEFFPAITKAGLQIIIFDSDVFKIAVKKKDIYKCTWDGYGVPPEVQ